MSSGSEGWPGQLRGSGRSGDCALEVGGGWPWEMRGWVLLPPRGWVLSGQYEGGGLCHWG